MTVSELLELLEDADPQTVVRIATQPSWPLAHEVDSAVEREFSESSDEGPVVWLLAGEPMDSPYAPVDIFE